MDILVKVSGSLIEDERFYHWLLTIFNLADNLFILCGGGDSITEALKSEKIPYEFGPQGREIHSLRGKYLAKQALKEEEVFVRNKLQEKGISARIFLPMRDIGDKICHINGDIYAIALYPNFDKVYIVTLKGRKKSFPEYLNKIEIVYL
ncbi:MAG: hypothetical protein Q7R46_00475 [bacterium]|nr:hypothetical protein [bacterium]